MFSAVRSADAAAAAARSDEIVETELTTTSVARTVATVRSVSCVRRDRFARKIFFARETSFFICIGGCSFDRDERSKRSAAVPRLAGQRVTGRDDQFRRS